jgi:hypothetical protein
MGRTSLMMVIGFNLIFMMLGYRMSTVTSSAYNKYIRYNCVEQTSLAAESGANIAISNAFFSKATPIPTASFSSGTGVAGTIQITKTSFPTVVGGTDTAGFNLTIIGADLDDSVVTKVTVQGTSFSTFVMFTTSEGGIAWGTGDVCYGNYHTQDYIYTDGNPDFKGLSTTFLGLHKNSSSDSPNFEGGYTAGVNIPLSGNFTELQTLGNMGGASYNNLDTYVQFETNSSGLSTGRVIVRNEPVGTLASSSTCWNESRTTNVPSTTTPYCQIYSSVSALTSSGVLLLNTSGDLHVKGVLTGQITLGNVGSGQVYIDSSVTYHNPAPTSLNPSLVTTDLLGIVANNNVWITDNTNNNDASKGVEVDASMYCLNGGFGAQNYSNRGGSNLFTGTLKIVGGIQEKARNAVCQWTTPVEGFLKDYEYNLNLQYVTPKGYPTTNFAIKNWVDSTLISNSFWQQ